MKGLGHYILAILFVIFAVLQLNDVDPYLWVFMYLLTAAIPFMYARRILNKKVVTILLVVFGLAFATYIPELIKWSQAGFPGITGSMKAETPFVELVRESMGLFLSFLVSLYYFLKTKPEQ